MYLVILLYALFASVFTISKKGLLYTQPFFFVGTRMLLAGSVMLLYLYFFKREQLYIKKQHYFRFLALAIFSIYLTNILEFWGLKYLTSFKTCFIYSLSPFLAALFSYFLFDESLNYKKWIGLLIGFFGFTPILINQTSAEELTGHFFIFSWAEIAVIGAAIFSVYGWILLKQLVQENGYSPITANGISMIFGGVFSLIHSYLTEPWDPVPVTEAFPFIECTLLLIVISNLVCYNLYGHLLKKYSATFMSFAGFLTPIFTAVYGWLLLGEVITLPFYFSAAIVFAGLLIFNSEELIPEAKLS